MRHTSPSAKWGNIQRVRDKQLMLLLLARIVSLFMSVTQSEPNANTHARITEAHTHTQTHGHCEVIRGQGAPRSERATEPNRTSTKHVGHKYND